MHGNNTVCQHELQKSMQTLSNLLTLPLPKLWLHAPFVSFGNQWTASSRGAVQLRIPTLQFVCYKATLWEQIYAKDFTRYKLILRV
jgi:hypothetical protein